MAMAASSLSMVEINRMAKHPCALAARHSPPSGA
jgi:hypothetical protein